MEKVNKIKVIIPFYNPGDYLDLCINSILNQGYENFDALFIDDCSTDESYSKIPACTYKVDEDKNPIRDENGDLIIIDKHPILEKTLCNTINAWKSNNRITALPNIHNAIINFSKDPEDIIFILYGDDYVVNKRVLSLINSVYNETDCLLTYGSCKLSDGKKSYAAAYNEKEFENLRRLTPKFSLPLTFRRSLYDKLIEKDPTFTYFNDDLGRWFSMNSMHALCFPLMELAGFSKIQYIKDVIYVYNVDNPLNSEKINSNLYYDTQEIIQNKPSILTKK